MRPWQIDRSELIYDRPPWLRLWEQDVTLPTGTIIANYVVMERRDAALVFAVTSDNLVVLTEQYRHGIGVTEIGLPAGFLDEADPSPIACAKRELLEETGYASDDWMSLGDFVVDPNRSPARYYYFLARDCRRVAERALEPAEMGSILRLVPLAELCDWRAWQEKWHPNLPAVTGLTLGLIEICGEQKRT